MLPANNRHDLYNIFQWVAYLVKNDLNKGILEQCIYRCISLLNRNMYKYK